jgi:5-methylcytosine-specific restriction endonuclease McrA
MPHYLKTMRARAYISQNGSCYYCGVRMWLEDPHEIREKFGISRRAIRLIRCTAEHLHARSDGGSDAKANIVAACWFCNQTRHRRKRPLDALQFRNLVKKRVRAKRWHSSQFKDLIRI